MTGPPEFVGWALSIMAFYTVARLQIENLPGGQHLCVSHDIEEFSAA